MRREFKEAREVAAMAQLGDARFDSASPGVPVPLAVAVALIGSLSAAFTGRGAPQRLGFQCPQAFSGKTDHLA
jgi:hypothetical protein